MHHFKLAESYSIFRDLDIYVLNKIELLINIIF